MSVSSFDRSIGASPRTARTAVERHRSVDGRRSTHWCDWPGAAAPRCGRTESPRSTSSGCYKSREAVAPSAAQRLRAAKAGSRWTIATAPGLSAACSVRPAMSGSGRSRSGAICFLLLFAISMSGVAFLSLPGCSPDRALPSSKVPHRLAEPADVVIWVRTPDGDFQKQPVHVPDSWWIAAPEIVEGK